MKKMWIITLVALAALLLAGCAAKEPEPEIKYRYCITQGESHFSTIGVSWYSDTWISFTDESTGLNYRLYGTFKFYTIPADKSCSWDVP